MPTIKQLEKAILFLAERGFGHYLGTIDIDRINQILNEPTEQPYHCNICHKDGYHIHNEPTLEEKVDALDDYLAQHPDFGMEIYHTYCETDNLRSTINIFYNAIITPSGE
jgi:hypothetical protein